MHLTKKQDGASFNLVISKMFSKLHQNVPESVLYRKGPRQYERDFQPNILSLPLVQAYDEEIARLKNEKKQLL